MVELRDELAKEQPRRLIAEAHCQELSGRTQLQEQELHQLRAADFETRDAQIRDLQSELHALRADHSTLTSEARSSSNLWQTVKSLRPGLSDCRARFQRENDSALNYELEESSARFDCQSLRAELAEWEEQGASQNGGDWFRRQQDEDNEEEAPSQAPTYGGRSDGQPSARPAASRQPAEQLDVATPVASPRDKETGPAKEAEKINLSPWPQPTN